MSPAAKQLSLLMQSGKKHRNTTAKGLSLFTAMLSLLLFIVQPGFSALELSSHTELDCIGIASKSKSNQQDQETPQQSEVVKADFSAVVPVGSLAVAQVPAIHQPVLQAINLPQELRNEAPKGITVFLKILFSRIITSNAP